MLLNIMDIGIHTILYEGMLVLKNMQAHDYKFRFYQHLALANKEVELG